MERRSRHCPRFPNVFVRSEPTERRGGGCASSMKSAAVAAEARSGNSHGHGVPTNSLELPTKGTSTMTDWERPFDGVDRQSPETVPRRAAGGRPQMRKIKLLALILMGVIGIWLIWGPEASDVPAPKTLRTFEASLSPGFLTHDIHVKHGGPPLRRVDVTFTFYAEREKTVVERYWNHWDPGQTKVLSIPAVGGSLQRMEITGLAYGLPRPEIPSFWKALRRRIDEEDSSRRSTASSFHPPIPWILDGSLIWREKSAN